jgi:hypothetical protein
MSDTDRELNALQAAESGRGPTDETVRRLRRMLRMLAEFSPGRRGVCPDREQLVAYYEQAQAGTAADAVRGHVEACPFCRADLADLAALSTEPLLEAVVGLLHNGLRLLTHSFAASTTPQPVAARGDAATPTIDLATQRDGVAVELRVDHASSAAADVRVVLRLGDGPLGRARIGLHAGEALLESRVASDSGEVVFADVPAGDYTVTVESAQLDEVVRVALQLQTLEEGAAG